MSIRKFQEWREEESIQGILEFIEEGKEEEMKGEGKSNVSMVRKDRLARYQGKEVIVKIINRKKLMDKIYRR